jgi:hypothetical protein
MVHWFVLAGLLGGEVGITNVYASNDSSNRCELWSAMAQELPHTARWILMGDFNMVDIGQIRIAPVLGWSLLGRGRFLTP